MLSRVTSDDATTLEKGPQNAQNNVRVQSRVCLRYTIYLITFQLRAVSAALALAAEPLVPEEPPPPDRRRQDGVHVRDGDALAPPDVRACPHLLREAVAAPLRPGVDAAERVGDAVVRAHGHERVAESNLGPGLMGVPISQLSSINTERQHSLLHLYLSKSGSFPAEN